MRTRRQLIAGLATILLIAGGCDGSKERKSPAAKEGGVLRIGTTDAITTFNPFIVLSLQTGVALSMTYPQLIQLDYTKQAGYEPAADLATSWQVSPDGKKVTFKLHPNAKWSDGKPLTAEDVAWTINIIVKFKDGPTGQVVSQVEGVESAEVVDPTTVVINYDHARGNALLLLGSGLPVLPKHLWEPHSGGDGQGLRTYKPEAQPGGMVSGGPYLIKQYERRGTTIFTRNPGFYGPKSHAEAVALTVYTNADSMVEDLTRGKLDVVEQVPNAALNAVRRNDKLTVVGSVSGLQADIFLNSNPRKPRHRELLNPRVREALAACVDRPQIIDVVFQGQAKTVETLVGSLGGRHQNTDLPPRKFDCPAGNRILDDLGYQRGSDGVRVVPAGAEPAHPMSYEIVTVANAGEFNVDRTAEILRRGWEQLGVKVVQKVAGDETATNTYLTGADCDPRTSTGYTSWDIDLSYSVAEVDPISTLSGELKESWCAWNFTGYDNPEYDRLYQQAAGEIDPEKRRQLLWRMQEIYYRDGATISLAESQSFTAYSKQWAAFLAPEAAVYTKRYYTDPHLAG